MKEWIKAKARLLFEHRTKTVGIAAFLAGGVENGCAQYGHYLSDRWRGILLAIAGVTMFLIGLWNSFVL